MKFLPGTAVWLKTALVCAGLVLGQHPDAFAQSAGAGKAGSSEAGRESLKKAPLFPGKGIWIPERPKARNPFDKKVTLVYFWDYTTVNSIREMRYLRDWHNLYHPYGFQVILVHAPEFEFAHQKEHVARAVQRMRLPYPVFLDNDAVLWEAYQNRSWPTKHLVDGAGRIFHTDVGEGQYMATEAKIRTLLQELHPRAELPAQAVVSEFDRFNIWECGEMTTELYMGHKRAAWWGVEIANGPSLPNQIRDFQDDGQRLERGFFLQGKWANREEYFEHAGETEDWDDYLGIVYLGSDVYAVLDQLHKGKKSVVYVERDGMPVPPSRRGIDVKEDASGNTYIEVDHPRLYYLIVNEDGNYHELKLRTKDDGFAIYVFSFSNACLSEFEHL